MGNNKRKITFLDTTLRDGEQAPGNSMNYTKKLELALLLEESGIETIETGFPASSRDDFIATKMISESLKSSNFATFSRTKIEDIELSIQAGGTSNRHILMLVATGSDLHLEKKRKITREKGVEEVKRAVSFAKSRGIKNIAVGIEDASRSSREYINILIKTSIEFGANQIILADTTGYSTPNEMYNLVEFAKGCINESVKLSVHCHNDLGLAVINSYFAVLAGADEIQGTIGGIGERAGNTSLEQIIGLISYKG
ncbi:TPA: 2-isopropylmalate synthase, partial [Staphylococcus aureus]|nr:2-isopropylmalate synthase [Staphylococcus aureus]HDI7571250.1 2-isopropylmalate synthase [Staphylococcus aureus]